MSWNNDAILRRFWGPRHLLQIWKTRTYGIVVEISVFLVNLPWQTSLVFFFLFQGIQLLDYLYQYERKAVPTSYERSFYSSSQNTDSEKVRDLNEILKRFFSTSAFWIWSFPGQILRLGMKQFEGCEWPLFEFKKNNSLKWTFAVVVRDSEFMSLKTLA